MLKSILKLFHRNDPDTSRGAAEHSQEFARKHEELILFALKEDARMLTIAMQSGLTVHPGLTKSELARLINDIVGAFRFDSIQVCRRMKKLEEDGKVIRTELKRKNAAGHNETVWRLA